MNVRLIAWGAALALVPVLSACTDSTTTPASQAAGPRPSFATAADTLPGGGGGPGNQAHFISNGDFASVNWSSFSGGGFTFGSLGVNRGGAVNNPQAFLSYFIEQCDPFLGCSFLQGFGQIPASDVSGGGKQLHLSTNTAGNPNFFTFGGSPGVIAVDWTTNGFFTQRSSGTSEFTFPGFRQHSSGVSTSASASASGSVVGSAIPSDNSGNIGTNQNVIIDISR
jgi:hypothetical protein